MAADFRIRRRPADYYNISTTKVKGERNMKRLCALMLASLMLIGLLAGCASGNSTTTTAAATTAAATTAATTAAATSAADGTTTAGAEATTAADTSVRTITCSDGTYTFHEEGYPVTDEQSTFSILVATTVTDIENTIMMKEVSEATNVYPQWQVIAKTARDERKALLWASNDYPDVIGANMLNRNDINTYGPGGILLPLNEYYDKYMTYFNELVPDSVKAGMYCSDGSIYYIPTVYDTERYDGLVSMNVTWLDKLGLEVPETIDDFYTCLVAIRDGDPNGNSENDEIPFGIGMWTSPFDYLQSFFSFFGNPGAYYVEDDGTVVDGRLTDAVREGAKFLQKCYSEGLLDPELFTQDLTSFRAKGALAGGTYGFMEGYMISYYAGDNTPDYDYMPPLADANGNKCWLFSDSNASATSTSMALTIACEVPEIVMRWANYIQEPLISAQINAAPIGYAFEWDENGNLAKIDNPVIEGYDSLISWREVNNEQQFPRLDGSITWDYMLEHYGYEYKMSDNRTLAEAGVAKYLPYAVQEFPLVSPTTEETEEINLYTTDINKYYEETMATWITGNADIDAEWDAYVAAMKQFGNDRVIEIKQIQSDRFFANID